MGGLLKPLPSLKGDQLRACSPRSHAAVSASAGTGKTHVLTARVLRLLLAGVDPSAILCLTFTKAGAAEMADRVHSRLAHWVRLDEKALFDDLRALGEEAGPVSRARARTLFARVLDATGGGLKVQTIHAFAQGLLAAFPAEAGLVPGFRPLEGREEQLLARQVLAETLVRAEADGHSSLIEDFQSLSHRLGEGGAERFVMACARAPAAMEMLGPPEAVEPRLRRAFELPAGDIEQAIAELCGDARFDMAALQELAAANRRWGTRTGLDCCDVIAAWQAAQGNGRAATLDKLAALVLRKDGGARAISAGLIKAAPDYGDQAARVAACCRQLLEMRGKAVFLAALAAALRAGSVFAVAYGEAKRAKGVADFDDLIRWAERLLSTPGISEWVRYKLDQNIDHILVDEAQDTNDRQWAIVRTLAEEYFAGEGASTNRRTVFTVGDYKQAIFGFQGTDPASFERAASWFSGQAKAVRHDYLDLSMDRSFRSSPPILQLVDQVIEDLGHESLGLTRAPNPHEAFHARRAGSVTLWQPYSEEVALAEDEAGEEGWVSDTVRRYAGKLARQIKAWLDNPFWLESRNRPVRPEDILVLVRRRSTLASLIVARLHAENVPVAGVDRLLLTAPLAVQDLLAAVRFAVQPMDDLNLASLLVSPLFGWSQEELFEAAHGRDGGLWQRLREGGARPDTLDGLRDILAMADYATPHGFLEAILSGPLGGRQKMIERLGPEARDPMEELLASALEFEDRGAASLQQFLDWFARGDVEIVRDPSAPLDAVRVMTVHGSKGLQSPVLILADACTDPERTRPNLAALRLDGEEAAIPIFRPRKEELFEPLKSQIARADALERQEHWRLLYVALTRAEERLFVGGSLGPADRNGPPAASWYMAIDASLDRLGADRRADPAWGEARHLGEGLVGGKRASVPAPNEPAVPLWLHQPAPVEARPPRPLSPSAIGSDDVADPPPSPAAREAAARGKLLHQLFERLPAVPARERAERADRWLERSGGVDDPAVRSTLVQDACRIISDPRLADLFSPAALAEAPIAAVVGDGVVVSGTVDRLLVAPERIVIVDFKTGRRAPTTVDDIPVPHLRQMAAYVAALQVIFPGRAVEAALLYTATPVLHDLPGELLRQFAPGEHRG